MTIGELAIRLGLDPDLASFAAGDSAISRIWNGLATLVVKAKQATVALVGFATETASYADSIDEASQKTGVSTTALQELAYAAKFSDLELGDLTTAFRFLSKNMVDAGKHGSDSAKAFKSIGVAARDSRGVLRPTEAVLMDLADAFARMPDGAKKAALATQLFGKAGVGMIPFLNAGRQGIADLRVEANRMGVVLDDVAIKQGVKASDGITSLSAAWLGLKRTIGAELLPDLISAVTAMREWIVENRKAIASGIHGFLRAIAYGFRLLWGAIMLAIRAVAWLRDNFRVLATVLGSVVLAAIILHASLIAALIVEYAALAVAALVAGAKAALAWAMILGPILLVAGAILLIVKYWDKVKTAAEGVWLFIKDVFGGVFQWIEDRIDALANAADRVARKLGFGSGIREVGDILAAREAASKTPGASASATVPGMPGAFAPPSVPPGRGGKSVQLNSALNLNINVPPGTSQSQTEEIRQAVEQVVNQALRAVMQQAAESAD